MAPSVEDAKLPGVGGLAPIHFSASEYLVIWPGSLASTQLNQFVLFLTVPFSDLQCLFL